MQPKIGQKVYCIYGDGIFKDTVGYLGKDSFIVSSVIDDATERDSLEWEFEDYDIQWFTNLAKAKKALLEKYQDKYEGKLKVVKMSESWYPLEYC